MLYTLNLLMFYISVKLGVGVTGSNLKKKKYQYLSTLKKKKFNLESWLILSSSVDPSHPIKHFAGYTS